MILFFDTETTGKFNFRGTYKDEDQPRVVQLAAVLTDDAGKKLNLFNFIIRPDGFTIPEDVSHIHGITQEAAVEQGICIQDVLPIFENLMLKAHTLVAHNIDFDEKMIRRETFLAYGNADVIEEATEMKRFCTMHEMTDVCKLEGRHGDYKWPSLYEAHYHCFTKPIIGAHNALTDALACAKIYFWLMKERKKKQDELPGLEKAAKQPEKTT